jgi:cytochrome c553
MGTDTGSVALWGEDASHLYGMAIAFAGQTTTASKSGTPASQEVLPSSLGAGTPDVSGILMCLSCHDGNYAKGAMMQNRIYETVPGTYSSQIIPTLLGNNGVSGAEGPSYLTSHPVGLSTVVPCGIASHGWDCTYSTTTTGTTAAANGGITPGPYMTQFINNYGWFVSPSSYNNTPVVMCTTCHNQHLMNVVAVGGVNYSAGNGSTAASIKSGATGLPAGNYVTMFFIRAPYNPATTTQYSNQNAQFCRQCHGGESNEWNGGTATTTF